MKSLKVTCSFFVFNVIFKFLIGTLYLESVFWIFKCQDQDFFSVGSLKEGKLSFATMNSGSNWFVGAIFALISCLMCFSISISANFTKFWMFPALYFIRNPNTKRQIFRLNVRILSECLEFQKRHLKVFHISVKCPKNHSNSIQFRHVNYGTSNYNISRSTWSRLTAEIFKLIIWS